MRIRRIARAIVITALLGGLGWVGITYLQKGEGEADPTASEQQTTHPSFNLTVVQQSLDQRLITICRAGKCQPASPAKSQESSEAVTDGTAWYHYQDDGLKRTDTQSDESTLVIARTPLVKPRGLFISPDNAKVAFWLDNIDRPEEQLTELWIYDQQQGGTRLLAEKVLQPGVLMRPRWNQASTHLWFMGQGGTEENPTAELLVVSLNPPGIEARFNRLNWQELGSTAAVGPMDISPDGTKVIFTALKTRTTSSLHTLSTDGEQATITVRGEVPYVQWLADGSVLYAAQFNSKFSFWRMHDGEHTKLAGADGRLQSVRVDPNNTSIGFAASENRQRVGIFTLDLNDHTVTEQLSLPVFGSNAYVVQIERADSELANTIPDVSIELDDAQLVAFVEQHVADIVGSTAAHPTRLITTDKANTIFIDFTTEDGTLQRVVATIKDAIHPEWSISARFEERSGEWARQSGGGGQTPNPIRLYEWEPGAQQWILKEEY